MRELKKLVYLRLYVMNMESKHDLRKVMKYVYLSLTCLSSVLNTVSEHELH
jgi:hypothetical protein